MTATRLVSTARPCSRRRVLKVAAGCAALAAAAARVPSALVGRVAAQEATPDQQIQPQAVAAADAEFGYVEVGQGDPVVFVHGSLNDFRSWGLQLAPFAERHRAIAYSRRYHWPNPEPGAGAAYAATLHADDLAAVIEALELGPVHLVGASYGALVALLVAARQPELVRTLVLGEPPLLTWLAQTPDGRADLGAFAAANWEPARLAFQRGEAETGVRLFLDGAVGPGAFDQLPPPARTMMLDNAPTMRLETQTPFETYVSAFSCDEAAAIETPALLLTGELSPTMFHRIDDELAGCLPNVERLTIPGSSHALHVGNPPAYNEAVLGFLAKH